MIRNTENYPTSGFCRSCKCLHSLGSGNAKFHARQIMDEFERIKRLDYLVTEENSDYRFSFDYLFGSYERGHMFGVLECVDLTGKTVILRAFSSLYQGIRRIDGWVPPLISEKVYYSLLEPGEKEIKTITEELKDLAPDSGNYKFKKNLRAELSRKLFHDLQLSYRFHNFRGECSTLFETFPSDQRVPGGVGDCCAPKLLNFAARNKLKPTGIAEFYWGGSSKTKVHGEFYPSCKNRCEPILGFMLCGLDNE